MDQVAQALFGTVTVPKTLVIHNKRLGLLNLVLTILFFAFALVNVIVPGAYLMVSVPVEAGLALWMSTDVTRSSSVAHCSSPNSFHYDYSNTYIYRPDRCQLVEPGEEYTKFPGSLFVPTYISDTHYDYTGGNPPSKLSDEFAVHEPEKQILYVSHGYKVPQPGFLGRSTEKVTESALKGDIMTVIHDTSGTECKVGNKALWTKADMMEQGGIYGPVEDFLACAGKNLDNLGGESYVSTLGTLPKYRVSGLSITLEFEYYNTYSVPSAVSSAHPHDGVTAILRIIATDAWTSEVAMGYQVPPGKGANGNTVANAKFRRRYQSGISIKAHATGNFKGWNYNALIAALVQALVFISLPPKIIKFVAFSLVGLLSKIYKRVATEQLDIVTRLPGLAVRLMTQTAAFRKLTGQAEAKISRGMTKEEVQLYLKEAFHKQMEEGMLDDKELQTMVDKLMANLDPKGENDISVDEFLVAGSSNEAVQVEDLAKFFDMDRKRHLGEICFGNVGGSGSGSSKVAPEEA